MTDRGAYNTWGRGRVLADSYFGEHYNRGKEETGKNVREKGRNIKGKCISKIGKIFGEGEE
jgi:hypothetical protein